VRATRPRSTGRCQRRAANRWRSAACYLGRRGAVRPGPRPRGAGCGLCRVRAADRGRSAGDHGGRAGLGAGGRSDGTLRLTRTAPRAQAVAAGVRGRSGPARNLQRPVHGDCRGDGLGAGPQRDSRSTSANGSIFPARCSMAPGRLVANAPHMPVHLGSMGESVADRACGARAGGRTGAASGAAMPMSSTPPMQRGHPSARHHRRSPRCSSMPAKAPASSSRRAATTPTSAGSRRDRCRRRSTRSSREGVLIDNVLLIDEGHGAERQSCAPARFGALALARNIDQNMADLKPPRSPPARAAADGWKRPAPSTAGDVVGLHGPRPRQCRRGGAAADRAAVRWQRSGWKWIAAP
jgi:hypothetical protein